MKGLLIKDFQLIRNSKNIFGIVIILMFFILFSNPEKSVFVVSYVSIIMGMLGLSTISYDEFDNGYTFLMTLPITRKIYVKEKYILNLLLGGTGWVVVTAVSGIYLAASNTPVIWREWMVMVFSLFSVMLLFQVIMLPIQLKFGGDRGKIVVMGIFAVIFLTTWGGGKILSANGIRLSDLINKMPQINMAAGVPAIAAVCAAAVLISYLVSIKIMDEKVF